MKKLITLLLVLVTLNGYSQKVTSWENVTYYGYPAVPVYSEWFKVEYLYKNDKDMTINVLPKNAKSFSLNTDGVKSKINEDIVRTYLLTSLNEFRDDYGLSHGVENEELTDICNEYSETIKNIFVAKHSKFVDNPFDPNLNKETSYICEGIDWLHYNLFTKIPDSVDINKVISDHIFDSLASCPAHADPLVREYNVFEIGFGLDFRETGIMVVLQYRDKKGDI